MNIPTEISELVAQIEAVRDRHCGPPNGVSDPDSADTNEAALFVEALNRAAAMLTNTHITVLLRRRAKLIHPKK